MKVEPCFVITFCNNINKLYHILCKKLLSSQFCCILFFFFFIKPIDRLCVAKLLVITGFSLKSSLHKTFFEAKALVKFDNDVLHLNSKDISSSFKFAITVKPRDPVFFCTKMTFKMKIDFIPSKSIKLFRRKCLIKIFLYYITLQIWT